MTLDTIESLHAEENDTLASFEWVAPGLTLRFTYGLELPVRLTGATATRAAAQGSVDVELPGDVPITEILTVGTGRILAGSRLVQTTIGAELRYRDHEVRDDGSLRIISTTASGVEVTVTLRSSGRAAFTAVTEVTNRGSDTFTLRTVTSWAQSLGRGTTGSAAASAQGWDILRGETTGSARDGGPSPHSACRRSHRNSPGTRPGAR